MDTISSQIYISRHVLFNENEFIASQSLPTGSIATSAPTQSSTFTSPLLYPFLVLDNSIPASSVPSHQPLNHSISSNTSQPSSSAILATSTSNPVSTDPMPIPDQSPSNPIPNPSTTNLTFVPQVAFVFQVPSIINTHPMITRSKDGIFKPKALAAKAGSDES